jgi:cytosine/adenosine deaminase-related metal-dependent hydrolase
VLRWASEGSARCLGRRDIGAIAVGRHADLAFYTLDELRFLARATRSQRLFFAALTAPTGSW